MRRHNYRIFSQAALGPLTLPNRLVRSATWDPCILGSRKMSDEVVNLCRELALGGVGLVITGGFLVFEKRMVAGNPAGQTDVSYNDFHTEGICIPVEPVHWPRTGCRIVP